MPRYIYPPRPVSTIHPRQLPEEEARGCWIWQYKFNGDRCVAIIESGSTNKVHLCNRHGKFHPDKKFPLLRRELSALNLPKGTHYLDGELLNESPVSETMVLFDVLQIADAYLIGKSQEDRMRLLSEICRTPTEPSSHGIALKVSDRVWMAEHGDQDFVANFEKHVASSLVEGLLLRKKGSCLDNWGRQEYEVNWQLRCRKNAKGYRF